MADLLLGAEERSPQVDGQDPVEGRGVEVVGRRRDLDPGVVDQKVDAAKLVGDRLPHLLDVVLARHVGLHQQRLGAGRADLMHAPLDAAFDGVPGRHGALRRPHVVHGDVHALLPQPDGDRLSDAGAARRRLAAAAIDVLTHGGTVLVAVLAACTINLRMVLYSASLAPYLTKDRARWRMVASYLLVDQVYAVAVAAADRLVTVPPWAQRLLRQIPPAALASIVLPSLVRPEGDLDLAHPRFIAGIVAALVAWRTKNVVATLIVGMALVVLLQNL